MPNVFKFDIEGVHTTYLPTGKYSCFTNTIFKKKKNKTGENKCRTCLQRTLL